MPSFLERLLESPMVRRLLAFAAAVVRALGALAAWAAEGVRRSLGTPPWLLAPLALASLERGLAPARRALEARLASLRSERVTAWRAVRRLTLADTDLQAA